MTDIFFTLPAATLVPIAAVATAVTLAVSWRRGAPVMRMLWRVLLITYLTALFTVTFFPTQVAINEYTGSEPWWNSINWVPLVTIDPQGFLLNVLLFAPLGFLLPAMSRWQSPRRVLLVALVVSVGIEIMQYADVRLLSGGRLADVNDVFANVAGAAVGYGCYRLAKARPVLARWLPRQQVTTA